MGVIETKGDTLLTASAKGDKVSESSEDIEIFLFRSPAFLVFTILNTISYHSYDVKVKATEAPGTFESCLRLEALWKLALLIFRTHCEIFSVCRTHCERFSGLTLFYNLILITIYTLLDFETLNAGVCIQMYS